MDFGSHADDRPEMKPATVFERSAMEAYTETPTGLVDIEAMEEASRDADDHHPELKPSDIGVISKDAKQGISRTVPPMGLIGVGVNESSYHFRVSLPGIPNTIQSNMKCEIGSDGTDCIQGVPVTTDSAAALQYSSDGHHMIFQQLSSPGPITVSFTLPGPVDPHMAELAFHPDGILEVVVMKSKRVEIITDPIRQDEVGLQITIIDHFEHFGFGMKCVLKHIEIQISVSDF